MCESRNEVQMQARRMAVVAAVIVVSGLVFHVARAQQAGTRRIDLQRHDLSVQGREVVQTIVELDPGVTSSRHTHPGEEIVYVLDGAPLEYELQGKTPVTLKPGDVLFIPAGTIHAAKNVGNRKGAELATYIVEKGKPLLTEVDVRAPR
jgi:quercetin dioxygenase-like cupin family protein